MIAPFRRTSELPTTGSSGPTAAAPPCASATAIGTAGQLANRMTTAWWSRRTAASARSSLRGYDPFRGCEMPELKNHKHEAFARALFEGLTTENPAWKLYIRAGFSKNERNAQPIALA
jgi:hypothetical protein